jgi:hypothetical protein
VMQSPIHRALPSGHPLIWTSGHGMDAIRDRAAPCCGFRIACALHLVIDEEVVRQ